LIFKIYEIYLRDGRLLSHQLFILKVNLKTGRRIKIEENESGFSLENK